MDATQHIVKLGPTAVELVDRTMIELARDIPMFRPDRRALRAGARRTRCCWWSSPATTADEQLRRLRRLGELMGDLGFPGAVVEVVDAAPARAAIWEVRKAGLNIMMSMKGDGKPVSFIEDCAVPLERPRRIHRPR